MLYKNLPFISPDGLKTRVYVLCTCWRHSISNYNLVTKEANYILCSLLLDCNNSLQVFKYFVACNKYNHYFWHEL